MSSCKRQEYRKSQWDAMKKKLHWEGIFKEMKQRRSYAKPSVEKTRLEMNVPEDIKNYRHIKNLKFKATNS